MKGIVGKKLGMTQVFDEETGSVEAVTVIEAGPCPVVTLRTQAADGYDAVQLAFEPVVDRKLSKGELGHLRKAGVDGHRHLVEFRGPSELQVGESVTVESFEPGDRIKVSGTSIGKQVEGAHLTSISNAHRITALARRLDSPEQPSEADEAA